MADELVAGLAVVVCLSLLFAYDFITDILVAFTTSLGYPIGIPNSLSMLMFLGAIGAGIVVYIQNER